MSKPRSSGFTPAQERELRLAGYENPERKLQPPRGAGRPRPDGERVRPMAAASRPRPVRRQRRPDMTGKAKKEWKVVCALYVTDGFATKDEAQKPHASHQGRQPEMPRRARGDLHRSPLRHPRKGDEVITVHVPREWLLNANQRLHWRQKAERSRALRTLALSESGRHRKPFDVPAVCTVIVAWPDKRRRDAHNLMPTIKACIDGIVDSGSWLHDDSDEWLRGPDLRVSGAVCEKRYACSLTFTFESA
jgi:crossover junction endodeoxyribonuclease RusA